MISELRLLTEQAKRTRFDFVWTVEGCILPVLGIEMCYRDLCHALASALGDHGELSRAKI